MTINISSDQDDTVVEEQEEQKIAIPTISIE